LGGIPDGHEEVPGRVMSAEEIEVLAHAEGSPGGAEDEEGEGDEGELEVEQAHLPSARDR
jgi:hypothetical protein